jgi:hypothetical protein
MGRGSVNRVLVAAALLAAAGPATAHGWQVALMPVGNLVALVVVVVLAIRVKVDWVSRVAAVLMAVLMAVVVWLLPNSVWHGYVPYWVNFSAFTMFVVGFVPPVTVAGLLLYWRRRARQRTALGAR